MARITRRFLAGIEHEAPATLGVVALVVLGMDGRKCLKQRETRCITERLGRLAHGFAVRGARLEEGAVAVDDGLLGCVELGHGTFSYGLMYRPGPIPSRCLYCPATPIRSASTTPKTSENGLLSTPTVGVEAYF